MSILRALRAENEAALELARALARTSASEPARRHRLMRFLRAQLDAIDGAVEQVLVPLLEKEEEGHTAVVVARALRAKVSELLTDLEEMELQDRRFGPTAGRLLGLLRWTAAHDRQAIGEELARRLSDAEADAIDMRVQRRQRELAARRREDLGLPP